MKHQDTHDSFSDLTPKTLPHHEISFVDKVTYSKHSWHNSLWFLDFATAVWSAYVTEAYLEP